MNKKIGGSTNQKSGKHIRKGNSTKAKLAEGNAKAAEHAKTPQGKAEERAARLSGRAARAAGTFGGKRRTRRNKTRRRK